ncbi:MAG: hypothetical protein COA84_12955, partial [Robiginitomaculum sp.]
DDPPSWATDTVRGMYLYGSRSMAMRPKTATFDPYESIGQNLRYNTDHDYSIQHSQATRDALLDDGFFCPKDNVKDGNICIEEKNYLPDPTFHTLFIKIKDGQQVQVVTRKNIILFMKVWKSIDAEFWYNYIWKSSPYSASGLSLDKPGTPNYYRRKKFIAPIMIQIFNTAISTRS